MLLLSLVSIWEIQLEAQLGKLQLRTAFAQVADQQQNGGTLNCQLRYHIFWRYKACPCTIKIRSTVFIIAQAQTEGASLLSRDGDFSGYAVNVVWR